MTQLQTIAKLPNTGRYSVLTGLRKNNYSSLFIAVSMVAIALFAIYMPRGIEKYAFFFFGVPVVYTSLVYGTIYGYCIGLTGFVIHIYASIEFFSQSLAGGHYMDVLVEGIIIVVFYFLSILFISKVLVNEREAQIQYKLMADSYALVAAELAQANENITAMFTGAVQALAAAIDAKDTYTKGHSERVTRYAVKVAREMGLTAEEVSNIMYGAVLHDIGKIGVDEQILRKPESLDNIEYTLIKKHPEIGAGILSSINVLEPIIPIVLHHHEHFDGKGYPYGLKEQEIPLGARIVAVVDAYDALTSDRPYKAAVCMGAAVEELRKEAGTNFDPTIIEAFVKVLGREH